MERMGTTTLLDGKWRSSEVRAALATVPTVAWAGGVANLNHRVGLTMAEL